MNAETALRRILQAVRNKRIWKLSAGPSTGSTILLDIGRKRRLAVPLTNPRLTFEQRHYEGEIVLMIECPWRLESRSSIICSWTDENNIDGPMLSVLSRVLLQADVEKVILSPKTKDIRLAITGGHALSIFCDSVNSDSDNYAVFARRYVYIVGPRSEVRRELTRHTARRILRLI